MSNAASVRRVTTMNHRKLVKHFRIDKPRRFRLADYDPADTLGMEMEKDEAKAILAADVKRLAELQERLYAEHTWAVLIILQGMDASGKDGALKHVMSGVNPQGCEVTAFKQPSSEELDHDFLWRAVVRLPRRGRIGIFNRSYYEELLVVRVHPELLEQEHLPPALLKHHVWQKRFKDVVGFERHLARSGLVILKFFLNISKEEQKRRFLARIEDPGKQWKFSENDVTERGRWNDYMKAYDDLIRETSTEEAPWHVVPADNKPFARLVVAGAVVEALEKLDLRFPTVEGKTLHELKRVRKMLENED